MSLHVFRLCRPGDARIPAPWAVTDAHAHRLIAFRETWAEALDLAMKLTAHEVTC